MDFSSYGGLRFRQPFDRKVEKVSGWSMLWALAGGPFFFWKKGARVEAILLFAVSILWLFYDKSSALISYSTLTWIAWLIWAASVVGAPLILATSYRRRGWDEIGEPQDHGSFAADDADRFDRGATESGERRFRSRQDALLD